MGFVHRAFVAAGVGFAVSAIVGCGSSGGSLLSQSQANTLSGQMNQVQLALAEGECVLAQRYLSDFQNRVSQLGEVNSTLLANLNQGASTIASLTSTQCAGQTVTTQRPHTTRTRTSPTTTTTATQTIPTFTQTTQTLHDPDVHDANGHDPDEHHRRRRPDDHHAQHDDDEPEHDDQRGIGPGRSEYLRDDFDTRYGDHDDHRV